MSDVSGVPYLGIPAMGGGPILGGSAAYGVPAMTADQINASMWGSYSPAQGQATLNSIYGPHGFGGDTAAYSALGAAYGRAVAPSSKEAVAAYHGSGYTPSGGPTTGPTGDPSVFETGAPAFEGYAPADVWKAGAGPVPYFAGGGEPYGGSGFSGFTGRTPMSSYGGTGYDAFDPSIYAKSTGFGVPGSGSHGTAGAGDAPLPSPAASGASGPYDLPSGIMTGDFSTPPSSFANRFGASPDGGQFPNPAAFGGAYGSPTDTSGLYDFGGAPGSAPRGGAGAAFAGGPGFEDYGLPGGGGAGSFSGSPNYIGGTGSPIERSIYGSGSPFDGSHGAFDPAGGAGSFADRFADFMRSGKPSEYTTTPYTNADGQTFQPGELPPGYQTPFSADNPTGALPRGGFPSAMGSAPIMNEGGDPGDTLSAQDASIPYWTPNGSFDPTAFNPAQFAAGSPFGSGRGVGGTKPGSGVGTMKDPTTFPIPQLIGGGFEDLGSLQQGAQYAGRGKYPALVGAPVDQYGNPFIEGSAPPYGLDAGTFGGGTGIGGLGGFAGMRI